jgi:hypothetical protein
MKEHNRMVFEVSQQYLDQSPLGCEPMYSSSIKKTGVAGFYKNIGKLYTRPHNVELQQANLGHILSYVA